MLVVMMLAVLSDAVVNGDQALTDLLLQTGPLGTLVVVLGGLVRSWILGLRNDMSDIKKQLDAHRERDDGLVLEVRDLTRRVAALEAPRKAGA